MKFKVKYMVDAGYALVKSTVVDKQLDVNGRQVVSIFEGEDARDIISKLPISYKIVGLEIIPVDDNGEELSYDT